MFRIAIAAVVCLLSTCAAVAQTPSALDRFSRQDRAAIEKAAPNFVREVKTGQLWDVTILRKYRRLEASLSSKTPISAEDDRDADLLGLARERGQKRDANGNLRDQKPWSRFSVQRLAFGRAWVGDHFQEVITAAAAEARLSNTMEPSEATFAKVEVSQVLADNDAIVTAFVWNPHAKQRTSDRAMLKLEEPCRLRGLAPGVDGDTHRNVYAVVDAEPFTYSTVLGARKTIRSFRVVKPAKVERSAEVAPEHLAAAILADKAKLTEWRHARTTGPKGEDGKATIQVEWVPEDVTPKPMVSTPAAEASR